MTHIKQTLSTMWFYSQGHLNIFLKKVTEGQIFEFSSGENLSSTAALQGFSSCTHTSVVNSADAPFVLFQMSLSSHVPTIYLKTVFLAW